jgi:hypothetical protein
MGQRNGTELVKRGLEHEIREIIKPLVISVCETRKALRTDVYIPVVFLTTIKILIIFPCRSLGLGSNLGTCSLMQICLVSGAKETRGTVITYSVLERASPVKRFVQMY